MRKVVEALGIVRGEPAFAGLSDTVWLLVVVAALVLVYTVAGGLWAVVVTDGLQLLLALGGALAVAVVALLAVVVIILKCQNVSFSGTWHFYYNGAYIVVHGIIKNK